MLCYVSSTTYNDTYKQKMMYYFDLLNRLSKKTIIYIIKRVLMISFT